MTPAGRIEMVMELLDGVPVVETCPTCGHEREVGRVPLISKETALKLLDLPEPPDPKP